MLPFTFLICSERSGSNLITKLYDSHSAFCGPSPSHLIRILTRNRTRYGNLEKKENWQILCADAARLLDAKLGRWQRNFTADELVENVPEQKLSALIRYVYEQETAANGKKRAFVKENHTTSFLPFLLANFPESKFVYLVRDPRDMALSYKKTLSHTGGVSEAVQVWLNDQQSGTEAYLHLKEAGKIKLITYEQLVENPAKTLTDVCQFLGEEFEEQMLDFYQNDLTKVNAARLKAWNNLDQPLLQDNFNKFKTGLTELEIRYTEAACRPEMELFGYAPVFAPTSLAEALLQELSAYEAANPLQIPKPDEQEIEIRNKRSQALQQVLSRNLPF